MSYDSVAGIYQKVAVPWFTPIADDLVAALEPGAGDQLLDLGTGTGLVASLAAAAVAPSGLVVGLDPSTGMLGRIAPMSCFVAVAGMAPGLPFPDAVFDVVAANLVLSHLPDLQTGLGDVVRVLKSHGRLGCTAWAPVVPGGPDNDLPEADSIVASVRQRNGLEVSPPAVDAVPFEEHLRRKESLLAALSGAGLCDLSASSRRYHRVFPVDEFLSGWGSRGRHLRHSLGEPMWSVFVQRSSDALHDRFGGTVSCVHDVWIVTGQRR
jgi:SAM-dependent methyltransferase